MFKEFRNLSFYVSFIQGYKNTVENKYRFNIKKQKNS